MSGSPAVKVIFDSDTISLHQAIINNTATHEYCRANYN